MKSVTTQYTVLAVASTLQSTTVCVCVGVGMYALIQYYVIIILRVMIIYISLGKGRLQQVDLGRCIRFLVHSVLYS